MSGHKTIPQLKEKMLNLNKTVFSPETDPLFYLYMERLALGKKMMESKDDRINATVALNDFILDRNSIIHSKSITQAEK